MDSSGDQTAHSVDVRTRLCPTGPRFAGFIERIGVYTLSGVAGIRGHHRDVDDVDAPSSSPRRFATDSHGLSSRFAEHVVSGCRRRHRRTDNERIPPPRTVLLRSLLLLPLLVADCCATDAAVLGAGKDAITQFVSPAARLLRRCMAKGAVALGRELQKRRARGCAPPFPTRTLPLVGVA